MNENVAFWQEVILGARALWKKSYREKLPRCQGPQSETNSSTAGRLTKPPAWHLSFVADFCSPGQWEQLFLTGCPEKSVWPFMCIHTTFWVTFFCPIESLRADGAGRKRSKSHPRTLLIDSSASWRSKTLWGNGLNPGTKYLIRVLPIRSQGQ